ncbi:GntP family permease [Pseudonocardia sp. HH130630-07]|uniref:GntP family permease n=1 Tax=Pseudonocardia sp. HH130630-07 TaxID=1690815 RepID=UPI00081515FB|nr:SLC13 family permease [Pseudonocardia sp. HH130630-07]ANY08245.1 gluconate permease [Pseudonocardia sp. HH130630-07]
MHDVLVLANTAVAVVGVIVLIVFARVSPVIALAVAALYVGLSSGLGYDGTVEAVVTGFGDILAEVGLLIAFGVLTGTLLHHAGAIDRLVALLLRACGPRGTPYATALTTGTVLQTIFTDVLVIITAPLVRRISPEIGRVGLPKMASALAIGSVTGVVLVVPGAAGVAIAGVLEVPLGTMLVVGLAVAVPTIVVSTWIMNVLFDRGWWDPARDEQPGPDDDGPAPATGGDGATGPAPATGGGPGPAEQALTAPARTVPDERTGPPLLVLFGPLTLGLVLIAVGGLGEMAGFDDPVLGFLGNPIVALLVAALGTTAVVARTHGRTVVEGAFERGLEGCGKVLVLTGVAGALAGAISATGLGDVLGGYLSAGTVAPLLVVWLMAAVIHVLIGTVTIAAIMSVGVLAPVAATLGIDPVLIALAAGSGSIFGCHVTSNTFWQFQALLGQSVRGTLKTFTVSISVASVVSILLLLPLSLVF